MPVKTVEKKPSKVDMKKAQGGQDDYAGWDAGRYDREGFGLGQFRSPVSEDSLPEAADVRQGGKPKKLDYKEIVGSPRSHRDQTK